MHLAIISSTSATGRTGAPFRFQVITNGGSAATRLAHRFAAGLVVDAVDWVISGTPTTDGSFAYAYRDRWQRLRHRLRSTHL